MTCLMEADVAPLVATLPIDLGREYISGLLRSYRRLVVALGGLFMPGLLSVRPLPIGQRPISFPFWGQCISLISLVMSNDTCEPSLAFTMATCLTMTGFRLPARSRCAAPAVRLSFPLYGLMPSLPPGRCCHSCTWRVGLAPTSSISCQG